MKIVCANRTMYTGMRHCIIKIEHWKNQSHKCSRDPVKASAWSQRIAQNHRILGVGRDLCWSTSPTPLLKQGHPEQAAQDLVQVGLEYIQRRRLHNLPGKPVAGLCHPQREEVLPHVQMELPLLQFVPIAPCPVAGHHWKESGPSHNVLS